MAKKSPFQKRWESVPGKEESDSPLALGLLDLIGNLGDPQPMHPDCERLEKSLYAFVKDAWPILNPANPFVDSWHVGCVCEHLTAMHNLEITKLILCQPPRTSKTLLSSVFWPAWTWTHFPESRWLVMTYGSELSTDSSVATRDVILSDWYQARWGNRFSLKDDVNLKTKFNNSKQGYRLASTVTGLGTGMGGTHIICDDVLKQQDATSDIKKKEVIDWFTKTLPTRGNDFHKTRRLVVGQRLAQDDLPGYIVDNKLGYETLILPMEYEIDRIVYSFPLPDPLPRDAIVPTSLQMKRPELRDPRTEAGELLCPERIDRAAVESLKATLLSDAPGQLQQRPTAEAGAVFQKAYFRYFLVEFYKGVSTVTLGNPADPMTRRYALQDCRFFQTIDTASTRGDRSAFTAIGTFAITPGYDLLVWDMWHERLEVMELLDACLAMRSGPCSLHRADDGTTVFLPAGHPWPSPLLYQAVENKSSGIGLIQQAAACGRPFEVLKADQSKVARAGPVATLYHNCKVFHRSGAPWLFDFETQMLSFPHGTFADMCFVAGTMISTADDDRPIESILPGDTVWTRDGLRRVISSGMTNENAEVMTIEFSDGRRLIGTRNHPVWVEGKGFIRLDAIAYGDIISVCEKDQNQLRIVKPSPSTVSSILDTRTARGCTSRGITGGTLPLKHHFIALSGRSTTERYQRVTSFTTLTRIPSITTSRTWLASRTRSIVSAILWLARRWKGRRFTWRESAILLRNGTSLKRAGSGTLVLMKEGSTKRLERSSASSAAKSFLPAEITPFFARTFVPLLTEGHLVSTTKIDSVSLAVASSGPIDTPRQKSAPFAVAGWRERTSRPVYNLTVADTPEYYANGILVHNCDVAGYAGIKLTHDRYLRSSVEGELLCDREPSTTRLMQADDDGQVFLLGSGADALEIIFDD